MADGPCPGWKALGTQVLSRPYLELEQGKVGPREKVLPLPPHQPVSPTISPECLAHGETQSGHCLGNGHIRASGPVKQWPCQFAETTQGWLASQGHGWYTLLPTAWTNTARGPSPRAAERAQEWPLVTADQWPLVAAMSLPRTGGRCPESSPWALLMFQGPAS